MLIVHKFMVQRVVELQPENIFGIIIHPKSSINVHAQIFEPGRKLHGYKVVFHKVELFFCVKNTDFVTGQGLRILLLQRQAAITSINGGCSSMLECHTVTKLSHLRI